MKKIPILMLSLFFLIASVYSSDVTLGLGWRTSNSGLVLGEYSLPINVNYVQEDDWAIYTSSTDYSMAKEINSFMRRGHFVFGMDFFLYKKQVSLGFELNAGYIEREMNVSGEYKSISKNLDGYTHESTYDSKQKSTIIPINFFVVAKYKLENIKESVGWIRPYVGIGGGLNSAIFMDGIQEITETDEEVGEKEFTNSVALLGLAGVDLFFSKKAGIFIEFRYIMPLKEDRNFRNQAAIGIGFRFI